MEQANPLLSLIVPSYNEEGNIFAFYSQLVAELAKDPSISYELIYVNDGSRDGTAHELKKLAKKDKQVRVITFLRNFGKEIATTAGIHHARGKAVIMLDADGQHPPELIHTFMEKWKKGAKIVVGVRKKNQKEGFVKKFGSKIFYNLLNTITDVHLIPGATDFRLIDASIKEEFARFTERNRITRGLIDWMGSEKETVEFIAKPRMGGEATYSISKLVQLAINSFISLSLMPLYFSGWAGMMITPLAFLAGLFVIVEQVILGDPLGLDITGAVMLGILLIFLVGLLLISQGLIALYISHIHTEAQNRPLYIIDRSKSVGV